MRDKKLVETVEGDEEGGVCIYRVTSRRRNNGRGADCVSDDATVLRLTNLAELPIVAIASCPREDWVFVVECDVLPGFETSSPLLTRLTKHTFSQLMLDRET